LKNLAGKVKVHGFRAGKVPMNVVKFRYSDSVRQEVARDMIQSSLFDALKECNLTPAGAPYVEPFDIVLGQDFQFSATFDIFPEFEIHELEQDPVTLVQSEVCDEDLTAMLDKLRAQHKIWEDVLRAAVLGDKVVIDFEGFLNDVPFDGGKATDYELELGAGTMIPGFETQLVGAVPGQSLTIDITFPADYGHADLAGKATRFNIQVKKVIAGQLPELDEAFLSKFNAKNADLASFKAEIKENMVRELERRVSSMNRETIFDALLKRNPFDLPRALVEQEIEHLKHEMYHRVFGNEHSEHEKIPDFPRVLFEEQAKRRVHLGLLFSDYVKKHTLNVDPERVNQMIETLASAYEQPDELRAWYKESKERLAEIEALVMEETVADKIIASAKITHNTLSYQDVVNPKENTDAKGD
jgi:trigger factor